VHALNCIASFGISSRAPHERRPAADAGRYAPLRSAFYLAHFVAAVLLSQGAQASEIADSWDRCYPKFKAVVLALAPQDVKVCGFFDRASTASDKEGTKSCAKRQWPQTGSVVFGHRDAGDDSMFCDAVVRDAQGKIFSVFFDSDSSGGGGEKPRPTLSISECRSLAFRPGTIGKDSFFALEACVPRKDLVDAALADHDA
jgi:hypothetical protein